MQKAIRLLINYFQKGASPTVCGAHLLLPEVTVYLDKGIVIFDRHYSTAGHPEQKHPVCLLNHLNTGTHAAPTCIFTLVATSCFLSLYSTDA